MSGQISTHHKEATLRPRWRHLCRTIVKAMPMLSKGEPFRTTEKGLDLTKISSGQLEGLVLKMTGYQSRFRVITSPEVDNGNLETIGTESTFSIPTLTMAKTEGDKEAGLENNKTTNSEGDLF